MDWHYVIEKFISSYTLYYITEQIASFSLAKSGQISLQLICTCWQCTTILVLHLYTFLSHVINEQHESSSNKGSSLLWVFEIFFQLAFTLNLCNFEYVIPIENPLPRTNWYIAFLKILNTKYFLS